jgi:hypothetical protein
MFRPSGVYLQGVFKIVTYSFLLHESVLPKTPKTYLGLFEAVTSEKLKADTYLSDMALSLGMPVVHVITGETEDLMSALITAHSGGGASTEITVAAISSFCVAFKMLTKRVLIESV